MSSRLSNFRQRDENATDTDCRDCEKWAAAVDAHLSGVASRDDLRRIWRQWRDSRPSWIKTGKKKALS